MQTSGQEAIELAKKLEKELNKQLFSITNTLPFITKCGEALDTHLSQVTAIREQSKRLLDCLDLPNKEETAAIANQKIVYEDRLDSMEDQVYRLWLKMKDHHLDLTRLTGEMAQLSGEFKVDKMNLVTRNGGEGNARKKTIYEEGSNRVKGTKRG